MTDPLIAGYMSRFETALKNYGLKEWCEIAADVRNHISEAMGVGKPPEAVLDALGSADSLARAYAVELLMLPPGKSRLRLIGRYARITAIVAAGSFVTLCVVVMLGGLGLTFVLGGVVFVVIGVIEAAGVHLSYVQMGPFTPLGPIALGLAIFALGWAACWALWLYIRMLARTMRKVPAAP